MIELKRIIRLRKKLTVNVLSLVIAFGLLLLVIPFMALAAEKENPEPGKKGDFSLFKGFYAATQITFESDEDDPILITAEAGEVDSYQWQAYSVADERYIDISGKRKGINITVNLARKYDYGDGKSYFRCHAVNAEGVLLTSDVLTVAFPAAEEASEPSETGETSGTVETIELSEPTLPGETEDTTASTEPTGEVTEATAATTEATTEATGESTQPADTTTEPTGEATDPTQPDQDGQSDDGETEEDLPPIRGMLLAPLRGTNDIDIVFDLDGGLGVSDTLQATSGETLIVGTPTKTGFVFTGWTVIDPTDLSADEKTALETEADNGNLTVPAYSVTFKANWVAQPAAPSTNYTIVYWLQNAAAGDNGYSVYSSKTVSGATPGSSVTLSSNDLLFPTSGMRSYVTTYKSNSEVTKTIAADGSTVFNVYYDRKTYTITFNINKPSPLLGSVSDPVFASGHSLTFTAKYGQKINTLWPDDSWVTTHPQLRFIVNLATYYLVGIDVNGTVIRNKPMYLTSDIITNGNTSSYSFNMEWETDNSSYTIVHRFQTVQQAINNNTTVGNFQTRSDVPNQTVYSSSTNASNYGEFDVDGFTYYSQNTGSGNIYRNYRRNSYKLHYANTSVADATLFYEQSMTKPSDPTKSGYTFAGWYSDAALTDPITDAEWAGMTMPAHDATVYAKWTKNPEPTNDVDVYLYKESGTLQNHLTSITTNTGDPAIPDSAVQNRSRAGYRFLGWFYDDNGTEREFVFNSTPVNADLTVYGKWERNTATVTVYKTEEDKTAGTPVLTTLTTPIGSSVAANAAVTGCTRTGYTLDGWFYRDASNTEHAFTFGSTTVSADTDVYGKWTPNNHSLIFANTTIPNETVAYGTVLNTVKPANPTQTGYTFGGWYADADFNTPMDWSQTMPDADKTVYAKWNINSHQLIFANTDLANVNVNYGTVLNTVKPSDPTKTGHTFAGWFSDAGCTTPMDWSQTMPDANKTVYAKWTVNKYNLILHNIDPDPTMIDVSYGTPLSGVKPEDPTRVGYSFDGWFEDSTFNYAMNWNVPMPDAPVEVWAKWRRKKFSVSFFMTEQDSTPMYIYTDVYYEGVVPAGYYNDPTRTGYVFKGWRYRDGDDNEQPFVLGETLVLGNMDVYAEWNPLYTVTFQPENGDADVPLSVENGTTVSSDQIAQPTREDYTFDGWYYMDEEVEKAFEFGETVVSGDMDVYAKWLKNEVSLTITNGGGDNVFTVSKSGFTLKIAIPAGQTATVTHLPFGDYTVTNGKWDYRNVSGISSQSVNASTPGEPISVSFGGSDQGFNWLGGEVRRDNRFGAVVGN